jgi:pyruvate dehydrogenase E1 component alpha subunit
MAQGAVHESMNLASVLNLPVLFVNNNNKYAMSTPAKHNLAHESTVEYAKAYNMPAVSVNGMDFFASYEAAKEAIEYVRSGKGPYFLECNCFRFSGQWVGDPHYYQLQEEWEYYKKQDPIDTFKVNAVEKGLMSADEMSAIEADINQQIEKAFEYAKACDIPDFSDITTDTYADKY